MRRGAPNCIRMNPRSQCASGMLGSSSTVYNEQPTSADSCLLGHAPKEGTGQKYNNLTKNPTYKRVCRAHPRAYGERSLSCRVVGSIIGSPPRIRGTRRRYALRCREARLIPTHTGNTGAVESTKTPIPAHPHAYGEHRGAPVPRQVNIGSSPRIRGTLQASVAVDYALRLIPTHTGNTPKSSTKSQRKSAHPHAYGEHPGQICREKRPGGSSPRIRGTRRTEQTRRAR